LEAETSGGYCLPEAQLAVSGIEVARSIYDTLTAPNEDGEIVPFLAESVEHDDAYQEWTITLRPDVTFHDGTPVDAEIVRDNLDAYRGAYKDGSGELIRNPLLSVFTFTDVESIEATDDRTVTVSTSRPWVAFDWFLWSNYAFGIMARAQLDAPAEECSTEMIGTGPFVLDSWTVNSELVVTRNEDYWRVDAAGGQLPYLDRITFKPIPEVAQRINALESGQIDITHTSDTEQIADRLRPLVDDGTLTSVESDAFGEVNYIMLNSGVAPFDDENARLAVAHALDRELLRDVRGGGIGTLAQGPFQDDVVGYVEDTGYPEFDLDAAAAAAEAYEAENGEPLSFSYSFAGTEAGTLLAQEIQQQLGEAGIDMRLSPSGDQATALNAVISGDFQAVSFRNHAGGDPDMQYDWWYSASPVNFGRIDDTEVDDLLDAGRTATEGRDQIYEDLNRRLGEQAFNLWTSFTLWGIFSDPSVHGIAGPPLPDDAGGPFPGLANGHDVAGLWRST
ncbi:MAG TPA: ABC transporter substrate-binding protein, partial [Iamia sp.]|nr:ABC transporter substrate-binding protein [Iamia sp.]